jgi:hypothetical protein
LHRHVRRWFKYAFGAGLIGCAAPASAQYVSVRNLVDVDFGTVLDLSADAVNSQSICVWTFGTGGNYSITATGSGSGNNFTLSSGTNQLPYQVRWNSQPGQTNGTLLTPGAVLTGQVANALLPGCGWGPPSSASLIVTLPAASLSSARAGAYSGTLTLIVAAE